MEGGLYTVRRNNLGIYWDVEASESKNLGILSDISLKRSNLGGLLGILVTNIEKTRNFIEYSIEKIEFRGFFGDSSDKYWEI